MRLGRLVLVIATLVSIIVFPLVARDALHTIRSTNAYAAPAGPDPTGRFNQDNDDDDDDGNNNNNNNNNNNDESDNEGESGDNDNVECFLSLNSNEEVPCDFDNNNHNNNDNRGGRAFRSGESVNRPTKCFDAREVGVVQMGTGSYDVTVQVMPHSSFNQTTRLTLRRLDPSSAPAVSGGTLVDSVVYELRAQSSCDGADIGTLPNLVNMGITYNVTGSVDKSKLQIVRWTGSAWENVTTVPDPTAGNPYVSATVSNSGTYALIQKP